MLGIGREFVFVEDSDNARLTVIGNRGYLPVTQTDALPSVGKLIKRLPILDKSAVNSNRTMECTLECMRGLADCLNSERLKGKGVFTAEASATRAKSSVRWQ